jgi:hypothetical protein
VQVAVTLVGLNEQVAFTGSPVHERLTMELNPLTGVTVILLLTNPPTGVDKDVGDAATVKPATVDTLAWTGCSAETELW